MGARTGSLTPVQEAEQARQVVNVLSRMERRFAAGRWERGRRLAPGGGNCLIGAIDEASGWVMPHVARAVGVQLARRLPAGLRPLAWLRPRLALALYNDLVGRRGAFELVRRTRRELGGVGGPAATVPVLVADGSPAWVDTGAFLARPPGPAPARPSPGESPSGGPVWTSRLVRH